MTRWTTAGAVMVALLLAACQSGGGSDVGDALDDAADKYPFVLSSSAYEDGGDIPYEHACTERAGQNASPPLAWINTPRYARALAMTLLDPDAPSDTPVVHWALINIPPEIMLLPDNVSQTGLPEGAWETLSYLDLPGYQGPCPPEGQQHRYIFTLYALKHQIPAPDEPVYLADIQDLLDEYTLKTTELLGYFPPP